MGWVGNAPQNNYTSFAKQDLTGATGGTLTLSTAVANEHEIGLYINHVKQEPTTSYTASGTTITLQGYTVAASDDIYVVHLGKAIQTVVPPDGSVTSAKLATNIQADTLYGKTTDGDSGINLATNDNVKIDIAGSTKVTVDGTGQVGVGVSPSAGFHLETSTDGTGLSGDDRWAAVIKNREATDGRSYGLKVMAGSTTDQAFALTDHDGSNDLMAVQGDGKIGIGTSSPQEQLHVYGGSTAGLRVSGGGNNNMKCEIGYDNSAGPYIKAGSSGQTDLHIYVDNNSLAAEFRHNTDFYSNDGTVHSLSDIRVKKDVADLTDGLDIVKQLKPRTFKYTEDSAFYNEKTKDKIKYGFIANEVEVVAPQYTDTGKGRIGGKEVNDFKTLSATKMIPMLVKAIQELSAKNDALEARITALEGK